MRVARYDMADPGFPVSLVEVDEPPLPGPAWARVDVALSGICGSDLHSVFPQAPPTRVFRPFVAMPTEMGHELCGTVVEAGPECPVAVGTRVTVDPTIACAARDLEPCPMCSIGATSCCYSLSSQAVTPGFLLGFTVGLGGGWGDQLVAHASQLHVVPDGVSDEAAVLTEPFSVAVHAVLRRLPPEGAPVLVIGAGMIGLTMVAAVGQLAPGNPVIVLARHAHQAKAAEQLGAAVVVIPGDDDAYLEQLAELAGGRVVGRKDGATLVGGYPAVVEAVGTGASIGQALRFVAHRGAVHFVGCAEHTSLDLTAAWFKEVDVLGAFGHGVEVHEGQA